jgi:hypothetical protein
MNVVLQRTIPNGQIRMHAAVILLNQLTWRRIHPQRNAPSTRRSSIDKTPQWPLDKVTDTQYSQEGGSENNQEEAASSSWRARQVCW